MSTTAAGILGRASEHQRHGRGLQHVQLLAQLCMHQLVHIKVGLDQLVSIADSRAVTCHHQRQRQQSPDASSIITWRGNVGVHIWARATVR